MFTCAFYLVLAAFLFTTSISADLSAHNAFDLYQEGEWGHAPSQRYLSDKDMRSPVFNVDTWNRSAISIDNTSHILITLEYGSRMGPYIFSADDLSLVYSNRSFDFATNLRVQRYKGQNILTYWSGVMSKGHAPGSCVGLNQHYEVVFNITASKAFKSEADLHECEITHDDTILVTIYEPVPGVDLTSAGGKKDDVLLDSCFEELDPETGAVLFRWRASWYFHPAPTHHEYEPKQSDGWDAWHINSLQKTKGGNYVVDLRRIHAIILVNGTDGKPIWQLGGKDNDFFDLSHGAATSFSWQHHTRFLDDDLTQLTLFDNHGLEDKPLGCKGDSCSRGTRLQLTHHPKRTVKLVNSYYSPHGIGAHAMGSYGTLPNNNVLIGWGTQASFTEFTADGNPVMDVAFARYNSYMRTYRVYKDTWVGFPKWNPKMAIDPVTSDVYVSWNGATEVKSWVVMLANRRQTLMFFDAMNEADQSYVMRQKKKGFETRIEVGDVLWEFEFVRVAALDKEDNVLGATDIVNVKTGRMNRVNGGDLESSFFSTKYNAIISRDYRLPRAEN